MSEINKRILEISSFVNDCYIAQIKAFSKVEYAYINDIIRGNEISSVLDVGTGEGSFISRLALDNTSVRFLAIDIDEVLISCAKKKGKPNNLTFENTLFDSSFRNESFDLILARFAVEHMTDVTQFIKEAFRRINSGGLLLITEYYIDSLHSKSDEWKFFREKELELYMKFGSHPRISLDIAVHMRVSGYKSIESSFRHISPSTVGFENFYNLIISYANFYRSIEPEIWSEEVKKRVITYCKNSLNERNENEDILLISHTIGRK